MPDLSQKQAGRQSHGISLRWMDFLKLFADQKRDGFPDLAGSEGQGTIRLSERLLNTIVTEQLRGSASIRELRLSPRAGNRIGVRVVLAKPSFLPPLSLEVVIDKQPSLPDDPVLGLTLSGMGGMLRFAGPTAAFLNVLPPGVRMAGERVFVDLRAVLAPHGLTSVLDYIREVAVGSEDGRIVVVFAAGVRG
jgi:hypothetical protein